MKARVKKTGTVGELRDYGEIFTPRYCIDGTFYNIDEIEIITEDEVSIMVNYPSRQQEIVVHCKLLHVQDTVMTNGSRKLTIILNDADPRDNYVKDTTKPNPFDIARRALDRFGAKGPQTEAEWVEFEAMGGIRPNR